MKILSMAMSSDGSSGEDVGPEDGLKSDKKN